MTVKVKKATKVQLDAKYNWVADDIIIIQPKTKPAKKVNE